MQNLDIISKCTTLAHIPMQNFELDSLWLFCKDLDVRDFTRKLYTKKQTFWIEEMQNKFGNVQGDHIKFITVNEIFF